MLTSVAAVGAAFAVWPYRPRAARDIPSGRIVLDYWEKWTGVEGQAVQRIVDQFNDSQNRIWVNRVPVSDIVAKSMVAIGGGDPPDLIGLFNFNIPLFAEAGAIIPLSTFGSAQSLQAEHYAPAVWRMLTYEDELWAGVTTCYTLALYYNRKQYREVGLDPDRPPRTVSELDNYAETLTSIDKDDRLARAGFMPNIPNWWPYFWPVMFGGSFYDKQTNQATLLTPENIAAYRWVAEYPRKYGRLGTQSFGAGFSRSFHSPQDPFLLGRVAMIIQGPWIANFIRRYAPDFEYGCAPAPVVDELFDPAQPRGLLESDVLVIPNGCPHPEEAFEFLLFVQRQESQEQLATDHCKPSPLGDVPPSFMRDHPNDYVAVHDAIAKSDAVYAAPQTRVWKQYADRIGSAFDAIWAGGDVKTELQSVQNRVQQLLDQASTRRRQRKQRAGAGV